MYEHRSERLVSRRTFLVRLAFHALAASGLLAASLGLGVGGYVALEAMPWEDALMNAAMLLGGMGPVGELHTLGGKLFASGYALFCGVAYLIVTAMLLAPLFHRMLHAFHLDEEEEAPAGRRAPR